MSSILFVDVTRSPYESGDEQEPVGSSAKSARDVFHVSRRAMTSLLRAGTTAAPLSRVDPEGFVLISAIMYSSFVLSV